MKDAEHVTFGGSGLDRAAELRGDEAALGVLRAARESREIVLWRGKPLVEDAGDGQLRLLRVDVGHPALARTPELFLGRDAGGAGGLWARDLSDWEPRDGQALPEAGGFSDDSEQQHPDLRPGHFQELRGMMTRLDPRDAELAATARAVIGWHATHGYCARCGAASTPVMAGWQRDCPACGSHHFPRTDPVVIMLVTHGNSVLLGRSPGWPEGMFSLLAGFVEPGETIEAAVRREVWEEAGVPVAEVGYLASQPWPFPASLMLGCHGRATATDITVDPAELEDAIWVDRERMLRIMAGRDPVIRPARAGAIAHFLLHRWLSDQLD